MAEPMDHWAIRPGHGPFTRCRDTPLPREWISVRLGAIDITAELQVRTLRAGHPSACCSTCKRRLLPGETLRIYDSGRSLCALCSPAAAGEPVRCERIHTAVTRVARVPRAA
jgi:hypothetical protein